MASEEERREQALAEYRKKLLKHKEVDTKVRSLRESVKELKKDYDKTEDDLKALQSVGQIIGEVLRQLDEERCELTWCTMDRRAGGGGRLAATTSTAHGLWSHQQTAKRGSGFAQALFVSSCFLCTSTPLRQHRPPALARLCSPPLTGRPAPCYLPPADIVKASSGPRYVVGCRAKVDKAKLTAGTRVSLDMTTLTIMRALPREVDPMVFNMLQVRPAAAGGRL